MRILSDVKRRLANPPEPGRLHAEKHLDEAIDAWDGKRPIRVSFSQFMAKTSVAEIAEAYRSVGGFAVEVKPPAPTKRDRLAMGEWILTDPERTETDA